MAGHAVLVLRDPGGHGALVVSLAGVHHGRLLELVGEVLGPVQHHGLLVPQLGHDGAGAGVGERVVLAQLVRGLGEGLHDGGVRAAEPKDDDLVLGEHGIGLGFGVDLLGCWADLAPHELGDPGSLPGSVVVGGKLSALKDLQRGIAANLEPSAGVFSCFRAVNLTDLEDYNRSAIRGTQARKSIFYICTIFTLTR